MTSKYLRLSSCGTALIPGTLDDIKLAEVQIWRHAARVHAVPPSDAPSPSRFFWAKQPWCMLIVIPILPTA